MRLSLRGEPGHPPDGRDTVAKKTATKKPAKKTARASTAGKSAATKARTPRTSTAKKSATKKPAARKSTAVAAGTKKAVTKKSGTPEPKPKAATTRKPSPRKADTTKPDTTTAKTSPSKPSATKKVAKKVAKKSTKQPAEKSPTAAASEAEAKPTKAAGAAAKKSKQPAKAEAKAVKPAKAAETAAEKDAGDDKKAGRKGITVVENAKKAPSRGKPVSKYNPPERPMLLGPGSKFSKPLIPSGPSAPKISSVFDEPKSRRTKSPLSKAKLEKYRGLLLAKRAELFGDVESMENEALRSGGSGGLSNTPQHLAEQGSESYDQTLSLNLAAQDRRLIKEVDEALARIEDNTYGLCLLTNQPISEERLDELPWARYTIEAARQLESRGSLS
jgi:DnaK suppressor protein